MLRRFLLGALAVSLASVAWAGVPDLAASTASIDPNVAGANVMVRPDGFGPALTEARLGGNVVDATITLTLIDTNGEAIFLYPFEDLWLETSGGGLVACEGGTTADASTDINGQTTWSNPLAAGGNSVGETVQIYVAGNPLTGSGLNLTFNSPDITGDLVVNLADIGEFSQDIGGSAFVSDYNSDGTVNLADIGLFSQAIGSSCN